MSDQATLFPLSPAPTPKAKLPKSSDRAQKIKQCGHCMARKRTHDYSCWWKTESAESLIHNVRKDVAKIEQAIDYRKNTLDEAADIANLCMMIADVNGELK